MHQNPFDFTQYENPGHGDRGFDRDDFSTALPSAPRPVTLSRASPFIAMSEFVRRNQMYLRLRYGLEPCGYASLEPAALYRCVDEPRPHLAGDRFKPGPETPAAHRSRRV